MTITPLVQMEARGHAAHLYDDAPELVERVAGYLGAAIANGGVALIAATGDRLDAFERALTARRIDVPAARSDGRLMSVDAEDVRRRLVETGSMDASVFASLVGNLVRDHRRPGRPTHVYGEIVALLWRDGLIAEAIELEALWNTLAQDIPFSLLCGYPTHLVDDAPLREELDRVCALHTAVTGRSGDDVTRHGHEDAIEMTTRWFPCSVLAPKEVREFVAETVRAWGRDDLVIDAALITSELATNALLHAASDVTVTVSLRPDAVRIALADAHPDDPERQPESATRPGGRGLAIVDAIASRWGTGRVGARKVVWAELASDSSRRPSVSLR
jgi:anti-sigma regulatory factor (Ser/Thr protein kinase)